MTEVLDDLTADRVRRLRLACLRDVVMAAEHLSRHAEDAVTGSPRDQLAVRLSAEVDRVMVHRGATHRSLGTSRRTLSRLLRGQAVTTASISAIADALDCDVLIQLRPRDGDSNGANGDSDGAARCDAAATARRVDRNSPAPLRTTAAASAGAKD